MWQLWYHYPKLRGFESLRRECSCFRCWIRLIDVSAQQQLDRPRLNTPRLDTCIDEQRTRQRRITTYRGGKSSNDISREVSNARCLHTYPMSGLASDDQNFTVQVNAGDHNLHKARQQLQEDHPQPKTMRAACTIVNANHSTFCGN